jgi:hypothetical protein
LDREDYGARVGDFGIPIVSYARAFLLLPGPYKPQSTYRRTTMMKEQFDTIINKNQKIQKRNPYGSRQHRKAYEAIRKAVRKFKGRDIGEYED